MIPLLSILVAYILGHSHGVAASRRQADRLEEVHRLRELVLKGIENGTCGPDDPLYLEYQKRRKELNC